MKKLICILLVLLLLTACGAPAAPAETTIGKVTAQLDGAEVVFEPWNEAGIPTSGDYYLTADVELAETVTVSGTLRLHLNGHTVLAKKDEPLGNMFVIPAGAVHQDLAEAFLQYICDPEVMARNLKELPYACPNEVAEVLADKAYQEAPERDFDYNRNIFLLRYQEDGTEAIDAYYQQLKAQAPAETE